MKRYKKYKPSGIEWIGEIPKDWKLKKLKYITYLKARVGWHGLKADEFSLNQNLPYCITGTDFNNGIINWETCYHISEERYNEDAYIQLKENDLLLTKDGTIGKVAIVKNLTGKAILNSGVFVMRPTAQQYDSGFMYWLIQSQAFTEFIKYTSKGSTIIHLYQDTFLNWPIGLPLLEEQTAIANYLDKKTAQIDELIAKKRKLIEALKEERTSIIKESVNDERKNWKKKKLKYIANVVLGKMLTNENKGDFLLKPYLRAANIHWLTADVSDIKEMWFSPKEIEKLRVKQDDLLVSEGGEVGRTCIWNNELGECYIQNSVHKISFNSYNNPFFFLYQFYYLGCIGYFESIVNRISIGHLTAEKLKDIFVAVPSLKEQNQIVEHLEFEINRIDSTISKIEKEIELIQEYRTTLISEVVTGKIKVV